MAEVKQFLSLIMDTFKSSESQTLVGNPSEVDEWLSYASSFGVGSELEGICAYANSYLALRTYFVGNDLTVADITIVAYLAKAGPRWESFGKSVKFPNLVRWYNCILVQYPAIANVLPSRGAGKPAPEVSKSSSAEAKEKLDGSFEVDLPGVEMGNVCTWFPPEPSGYLHIGHAKATLLNQFFAQKHKGRLIIRFDNTNPAIEKDGFVESTLQDLDTLGVKGNVITYTSDYFPQLMEMCEKLMKEEKAYVDDAEREQMQLERKYKVYPTYDFACPFVDSIEGVTHALRSSEYHDRNDQYYRVLEDMQLRKIHVWDFSRLNFVYTLLSKRKLQWFVDSGRVEGWYDPRFPTVQGIIRRGLTIEALKRFILSQGALKNLNLMEWDKLWTINKKIIDPVCPRHTAVLSEGKVLLDLSSGPETPFTRVILRHKKYEPAGKKATVFTKKMWLDHADATTVSEGVEVSLMHWSNCFIGKVERDQYGLVTRL
uniref:GST C-terminal domain-containing protein n=1 Tax=Physcomitrium patens TaxID=3218 RepID=A0A7I4B2W1_PHYPA